MKQQTKIVFNWSGGKDSALALYKLIKSEQYDIVSLLTTINKENKKSTVHDIPLEILEQQARSLGIPLYTVLLSEDLKDHDNTMQAAIMHFKQQGVSHFAFGDIFLADVKTYRESKLLPLGINLVEPLWNQSSEEIIQEFLDSDLKAKIIVTQADKLSKEFVGKDLSPELIDRFPKDVDICGENGEYHTLVYDGPVFRFPINFEIKDIVKQSYDITLNNLETKKYEYWKAVLI